MVEVTMWEPYGGHLYKFSLSKSDLLKIIEDDLTSRANIRISAEELREKSVDDIGYMMSSFIHGISPSIRPQPEYWTRLKNEIHELICTDSKRYAALRRKLNKKGANAQTAIVATISAGIASHLGFAAGALVPFCALCLLAIAKVGQRAFCQERDLDHRIGPEPKGERQKPRRRTPRRKTQD
jgi:hypothetical protein